MNELRVIDSHTGGEPTRVVVDGLPELGTGPAADRLEALREAHDWIRTSVILEPRGSDVMVGAALLPPEDPANTAAVVFFNNVGYLGMCGHGTIGFVETLRHLERIGPGEHRIETPAGLVRATLASDGRVTVQNVASHRLTKGASAAGVTGDIVWGGNWFFICEDHGIPIRPENIPELTAKALEIRATLDAGPYLGEIEGVIDHVELVEPLPDGAFGARGFVLCPGGAYDRSPCGTGTSAKLACLHADGKIVEGQVWRQESVIGSAFEGRITVEPDGTLIPHVTGRAHITGDLRMLFDPKDPFRFGIG